MKYELETIPVWDGLAHESECFLCDLMQTAEQDSLLFYLGSSVMNPQTRVEVNKKGFCPDHFDKLVLAGKPQALALLCETYLSTTRDELKSDVRSIAQAKKAKEVHKLTERVIKTIDERSSGCLICDKMEHRLNRYCFTTAYLWGKDEEFRSALEQSKGVCLHHLKKLLTVGKEALDADKYAEFVKALMVLTEKNLDRIEADVLWMTQKYKSENIDKPWNGCEDAQKRAVQKLIGKGRIN